METFINKGAISLLWKKYVMKSDVAINHCTLIWLETFVAVRLSVVTEFPGFISICLPSVDVVIKHRP